MPRPFCTAFVAVLAATALAPVVAAQQVESPIYKSWARHPVGTSVALRSVTGSDGRTIETTTTSTLLELTAEKAVVETVVVSDATGEEVKSPPQKFEHRRMFPLFPGMKAEDIGKPVGVLAQGEEAVEVGGKTYPARWFESKGQTEAGESVTRTWMSDEVPGRLLKAVTRVPATGKTTALELIELKTP